MDQGDCRRGLLSSVVGGSVSLRLGEMGGLLKIETALKRFPVEFELTAKSITDEYFIYMHSFYIPN